MPGCPEDEKALNEVESARVGRKVVLERIPLRKERLGPLLLDPEAASVELGRELDSE